MQIDVVIVGASVTGSALATLALAHGLSVALVDSRDQETLGAPRRPVPVPVWALEESRLPVGEVIRVPSRLHLVAGSERTTVATPNCVMLEHGALVASLVERAIASGATFHQGRVVGLAPHGDGVRLEDGSVMHAKFVIDASGEDGAALLGERAVEPGDVASIAHETRRIGDRRLADAYLEAIGAERGESVVLLAPRGPGSLVVARVDDDARTFSFDAVMFGDADRGDVRRPTARAAIRRVVSGFPWLGESISDETRHIAVGGLRGTFCAGNVALAGGAAGMTRPGIGGAHTFGMVSARILADTLAEDGDLSRYERRVRARFDDPARIDATVARWFRSLDEDDLASMLRTGAIGESLVATVLEQRAARLPVLRFAAAAAVRNARAAAARTFDLAPTLHAVSALRATIGGRG